MTAPPHRPVDEDLRAALAGATTTAQLARVLADRRVTDPWEVMRVLTDSRFPGLDLPRYVRAATAAIATFPRVQRTRARAALERRWTLRHYSGDDPRTPPGHTVIRSALDLQLGGGASGSHTNAADWRAVGNVAFTFGVAAVDGHVPDRRWLGDCHWYAEWDLTAVGECWVSGDLLGPLNSARDTTAAARVLADRAEHMVRGTGDDVRTALALLLGAGDATGAELVRRLDTLCSGGAEVKVAGPLTVGDWRPAR